MKIGQFTKTREEGSSTLTSAWPPPASAKSPPLIRTRERIDENNKKLVMAKVKLIEKAIILPKKPTQRSRLFLSNIDLSLVVYQESVSFFDPPTNQMKLPEAFGRLCKAFGTVLTAYDFLAGRLVRNCDRFEIDCNDNGMVVAAAITEKKLCEFGEILSPRKELEELVVFLHEEGEDEIDVTERPLISLQLTQFGCGSLALASLYNHCIMDGITVSHLEANLAAATRGDNLVHIPNSDRTLFKARNPPTITYPHFEFSTPTQNNNNTMLFTSRGTSESSITVASSTVKNNYHVIYMSPKRILELKKAVIKTGKLKNCSTFQVVAAQIWKARSIALKMEEETISTMLFPVDARKRIVPEAPTNFAGNALVPGYARASVKDLKEEDMVEITRKVQEGVERLDDEYVRSAIDWLEVHKGVPCQDNSFSLVAWLRLGLEEDVFAWGEVKCTIPIKLKPDLVMLLPGPNKEGGINICLQLGDDQVEEFKRFMTGA